MRASRAASWMSLVLAATACGDVPTCETDPCRNDGACTEVGDGVRCACTPGFAGERCELAVWTWPAPTRDLDLLFVVDDSGSMASEQQRLVDAFGELLAPLVEIGGELPNLHIGVVSSNVGAAGQTAVPGCPGQGDDGILQANVSTSSAHCPSLTDAFAVDVAAPGGRETNYTGSLSETFACLAVLGTTGCGFEMHLESAWRALQPDRNAGFHRPDAHLAVIVLADEDDCSTRDGTLFGDPTADLASVLGPRTSFRCHEFGVVCDDDPTPRAFGERSGCRPIDEPVHEFPVAKYTDFFAGLKAPGRLTVAVIAGTFDGSHLSVAQDPAPGAPAGYPAVQRSCGYDELDPNAGASPPVRLSAFLRAFGARGVEGSACEPTYEDDMRRIGTAVATSMASAACIDRLLAGDDRPSCTVVVTEASTAIPISPCALGQSYPCWNFGPEPQLCPGGANALWVTGMFSSSATIDARCETR